MSIVTNKEEKKFLTEEELKTLKEIQTQTQSLILELGEIEMVKLQTEKRHKVAKSFLDELTDREKNLTKSIFEKYLGKMDTEKWMERSFNKNYISEVDFFEKMDSNDPPIFIINYGKRYVI